MSEDRYQGYAGSVLEVLKREGISVWDRVKVKSPDGEVEGIILPRSAGDKEHLVIKMFTGYNIGIRHDHVQSIEHLGSKKANYKIPEKEFPFDENKRVESLRRKAVCGQQILSSVRL